MLKQVCGVPVEMFSHLMSSLGLDTQSKCSLKASSNIHSKKSSVFAVRYYLVRCVDRSGTQIVGVWRDDHPYFFVDKTRKESYTTTKQNASLLKNRHMGTFSEGFRYQISHKMFTPYLTASLSLERLCYFSKTMNNKKMKCDGSIFFLLRCYHSAEFPKKNTWIKFDKNK